MSALVRSTPEPAGANCTHGGMLFEAGSDADRDGYLENHEVDADTTRYVCNGEQGPQGAQGPQGLLGVQGPTGPTGVQGDTGLSALVRTSSEAGGANCATGGVKLETGIDTNRNNTLDAGEVNAALTRFVCNGPQGPQGIQGTTGATGPQGATGTQGLQGVKGDMGDMGATGPQGPQGATGPQGLQGAQGPQGATGPQGLQGSQGPQGAAGLHSVASTTAEPMGANCATGGVRLRFGSDTNSNGTLDAGEVNAALTRYVCNGDQGPQGIQGPAGATGPAGPPGPAGTASIFGDGSGGAFTVDASTTVNLATPEGYNLMAGRQQLQFTSVTINGILIVPSGMVIRATGDFTVSSTGAISVAVSAEDTGAGSPGAGVARGPAGEPQGGRGLVPFQAAQLVRPGAQGGGSGAKAPGVSLGQGGGSLVVLAQGTVRVVAGGAIAAIGESGGTLNNTPGGGGGAGGVIVLLGKTAVTVNGSVRAYGGSGGAGNNAGGTGKGGGGGGGGGIVHLLSSTSPLVTGVIDVNPGAAGDTASPTGGSQAINPGGGGGACGGNGGDGASGTLAAPAPSQPGLAGYRLTTVTPSPENNLL